MIVGSQRASDHVLRVIVLTFVVAGCATGSSDKGSQVVELEPTKLMAVKAADGSIKVESQNPRELFREGGRSFEDGNFPEATRKYELIVRRFPKSRYANVARFNAGLALEKNGQFKRARRHFLAVAEATKGSKDAQDALMHAATCEQKLGDHDAVIRYMDRVLKPEYPDITPLARLEAHARRGRARHQLRQLARAERDYKAALKLFKKHIANRTLRRNYYVSQAQFQIGEIYRELFGTIRFRLPLERMARDLEDKSNFFLKSQAAYLRTLRFNHPDLAVAAGFRLGAIYEQFYDDMMGAEVPADLSKDEVAIYYDELKRKIRPLITKAIDIYERNIRMAQRLGKSKAEWVRKSRASLARLKEVLRQESVLQTEKQLGAADQ